MTPAPSAPSRRPARSVVAVVLAAGRGTRLKSDRQKVLHDVCGRPALWHVVRAALAARPRTIVVVVHHGREAVEETVRSWGLKAEIVFVDQGTVGGTGHAVLAARQAVGDADDLVVLAGDDPLVTGAHVRELLATHRRTKAAATIQSKHAIQIFDHGVTDNGRPYIVMELLVGEPLDKRIEAYAKSGSALSLPYEDGYCDLVFTSGVLIHIAPDDLPRVMDEIHRCARTFIWGLEYYAPDLTEINYRSRNGLLWKTDFAQRYLERFADLELVREQRLSYLESTNVDTVFLLRKKH